MRRRRRRRKGGGGEEEEEAEAEGGGGEDEEKEEEEEEEEKKKKKKKKKKKNLLWCMCCLQLLPNFGKDERGEFCHEWSSILLLYPGIEALGVKNLRPHFSAPQSNYGLKNMDKQTGQ